MHLQKMREGVPSSLYGKCTKAPRKTMTMCSNPVSKQCFSNISYQQKKLRGQMFFTAQTVKQAEKLQIFTSVLIPPLECFFLPKIFMTLLGHVIHSLYRQWLALDFFLLLLSVYCFVLFCGIVS